MLANDRDRLSGGNVEAWTPGFLSQDSVEVLLNDLFSPRQSIVPAPLIDYGAVPATEGWSTSMHCVRCWVDPMLDSGKFFLRRVIGLPPFVLIPVIPFSWETQAIAETIETVA
jgi:hypothetical protein